MRLDGTIFAGGVEIHAVLGSTIDRCRELAEAGAPQGRAVIADAQSAGRGQPGHAWHSPAGQGLYLSALLRPSIPVEAAPSLAVLAGLSACEALRGLGVPCRIKLPNDLVAVFGGAWRKLGGMLVDTAIQGDVLRHAIVSFGINVALRGVPAELRDVAVSCRDLASPLDRDAVAGAVLRELDGLLPSLGSAHGREALAAAHAAHVRTVAYGDAALPGAA